MSQLPPPEAQFALILREMREFKHSSTNLLAVLSALAEMGRTNSKHAMRLCEVVQERVPGLVENIAHLSAAFRQFGDAHFNLAESASRPPASSESAPEQDPGAGS